MTDITIRQFQDVIARTFGDKDEARGMAGTFMWFSEEVGELARALKRKDIDRKELLGEFSDVFAWLCTLASMAEIDMEEAVDRYMTGCPRCDAIPCACGERTRFQVVDP